MEKTKKALIFLGIFILMSVFLFKFIESDNGPAATYCAEKTINGASCQNVPLEEVNTVYQYERTSCESTSYCSTGTCVDTQEGNCMSSPQSTCNPEDGGLFYNQPKEDVTQCKIGCCLLGDGASLVERVRCDAQGKNYGVTATFRADIQDEAQCLSLASLQEKGACVFETDIGRDCKFETREGCIEGAGEFHSGFLCSAPELGTKCVKTKNTRCIEGKNEVYYTDSCGNLANIYDADKVEDISYWSYVPGVKEVEVNLGDGTGNINSPKYGACDYFSGSTCGRGNAQFGSYICKDLGCSARSDSLTGGVRRNHGEAWCSEPLKNFENATPGQISYLLYCYNGEVEYELCDNYRNSLCLENSTSREANCISNDWASCLSIDNTDDCENTFNCKVMNSEGILPSSYGTRQLITDSKTNETKKASCVPKYPPGFAFWNPDESLFSDAELTGTSLCELANVVCYVHYTQEVAYVTDFKVDPDQSCIDLCEQERGTGFLGLGSGSRSCRNDCTPVCLQQNLDNANKNAKINQQWAKNWQNTCNVIGDCGVSANYMNKDGYYKWKDLFTGTKIDWSTLPNTNSKK
jgi:hypothetical protein